MDKLAIVILNFNGEKLLPQFLPSVIAYSENCRIVVADNGSSDQSVKVLRDLFPTVEIIELERNFGFCGGYNRALKQLNASLYVLLNSDVEVTPGWLQPLTRLLDNDPSVAAVQPKILSHHHKDHFEYAGAAGGFIDALGYPFCRGRVFDFIEKDEGQYDDTCQVFWASGACMMIRAEVYHTLGGLDETFFAHMEEIDLCWKIQRSGKKVYYTSLSKVYHVGGGTLSKSNPRKTYYNFQNGLKLIFKNMQASELLFKLPLRIWLDYVAAIKFAVQGSPNDAVAVIRAHFDFALTLQSTIRQRNELSKRFPFTREKIYEGLVVFDFYLRSRKVFTSIVPDRPPSQILS